MMGNPFRRDKRGRGPHIPAWYSPAALRTMTPQQIADYDHLMVLYCEATLPRETYGRLCELRTLWELDLLGGARDLPLPKKRKEP